ncbi:hypothetical protein AVL61_06685 [Kocuria rosea subsp. polaris]|uniref:Uncharacterized protein n=1 Tax=Kocuria rosea subsp. polaris TaxID=136273 RepID=A0A0W8I367_KOCRO|nr:hypothetical protein AVL61_06685 [Kocuria polaris]
MTTTSTRSGAAAGPGVEDAAAVVDGDGVEDGDDAPAPSGAVPAGCGEQPARTVAPVRRSAASPAAGPRRTGGSGARVVMDRG